MEKRITFWIVALIVFVLDRASKLLIVKFIPLDSSISVLFFSLTHVLNTGTVFGLFRNASLFFIVFSLAVVVFLAVKHSSFSQRLQPVLGLVLGGAFGNLFDRFLYGAVVDFLDFGFWPSFNIADSAISIAVFWLLLDEYVLKKRKV